eukprot:TRINITY_DN20540_c0_g1_i2.p1 TRINITY_DN20540_c0_g1~~TRINITY_DN20540_c0_g1_i2.p1  ORF type:complete len:393 (+),score=44.37 TRINITY_DN20540_c0_g1_i2:108-1286(+)
MGSCFGKRSDDTLFGPEFVVSCHDHPVVASNKTAPWKCDSCSCRSRHFKTPRQRYRCAHGCSNYDLCQECCDAHILTTDVLVDVEIEDVAAIVDPALSPSSGNQGKVSFATDAGSPSVEAESLTVVASTSSVETVGTDMQNHSKKDAGRKKKVSFATDAVNPSAETPTTDTEELFEYIKMYTPKSVELEPVLKPFIPELTPSVGQVDLCIKPPLPEHHDSVCTTRVVEALCTCSREHAVQRCVTLQCTIAEGEGPDRCAVSCVDVSGSELASIEVDLFVETLSSFRSKLVDAVSDPTAWRWQFLLPAGDKVFPYSRSFAEAVGLDDAVEAAGGFRGQVDDAGSEAAGSGTAEPAQLLRAISAPDSAPRPEAEGTNNPSRCCSSPSVELRRCL